MDLIFPGEFTGAGTREHDSALCRLEHHRHLVFAGAELDLKRAFWEWSIYSHLAEPSCLDLGLEVAVLLARCAVAHQAALTTRTSALNIVAGGGTINLFQKVSGLYSAAFLSQYC
jgi:hypothetical protein